MLLLFKTDPIPTTDMKSEPQVLERPCPDSTYETLLIARKSSLRLTQDVIHFELSLPIARSRRSRRICASSATALKPLSTHGTTLSQKTSMISSLNCQIFIFWYTISHSDYQRSPDYTLYNKHRRHSLHLYPPGSHISPYRH